MGIDYSMGNPTANRNEKSGIRYGIISGNRHDLAEIFNFEGEDLAHGPNCPNCGDDSPYDVSNKSTNPKIENISGGCDDFYCKHCGVFFDSSEAYGESYGSKIDNDELKAFFDYESGDIWVYESNFVTFGEHCSPCAPGAIDLDNPVTDHDFSHMAYCLPPDFFDGEPPYTAFKIDSTTAKDILK